MAYLHTNPTSHVAFVHYDVGFVRIYTIIFNFSANLRGGVKWSHVAFVHYVVGFVRIYTIIFNFSANCGVG